MVSLVVATQFGRAGGQHLLHNILLPGALHYLTLNPKP